MMKAMNRTIDVVKCGLLWLTTLPFVFQGVLGVIMALSILFSYETFEGDDFIFITVKLLGKIYLLVVSLIILLYVNYGVPYWIWKIWNKKSFADVNRRGLIWKWLLITIICLMQCSFVMYAINDYSGTNMISSLENANNFVLKLCYLSVLALFLRIFTYGASIYVWQLGSDKKEQEQEKKESKKYGKR